MTALVMIAALLVWAVPVLADDGQDVQTKKSAAESFIDLDGDGFNDNAEDQDLDGIPNDVDPDYVKPEPQHASEFEDYFALDDVPGAPKIDLSILNNAQRFCRLQMSVRSLAQCRGAFESANEFGVGDGIGSGAVGGGVCQGGVCVGP